jgi:hypothetical protein
MDWKSYDEYNFRKRQEVLDAKKRDEEQRARMKEDGVRAWQHLLDIMQGGKPSRNPDLSPEVAPVPGMLYEDPQGYVRNNELDRILLQPETLFNATPIPSVPSPDLPGTLDQMPPIMRPGYDRLPELYAPQFNEKVMPNAPRFLPKGPGMLKVADNTGGMNPIMQAIRREQLKQMPQQPPNPEMNWLEDLMNKWQEGAGAPRPQPYDPRRYNPRGYDNFPGVNSQPVPNPNPAPHPWGSGVRG